MRLGFVQKSEATCRVLASRDVLTHLQHPPKVPCKTKERGSDGRLTGRQDIKSGSSRCLSAISSNRPCTEDYWDSRIATESSDWGRPAA